MNQLYLEHVRDAKESLRIWISNVEQLHNGIEMFSNENELDRNNTDFAKWYYGEGQTFISFETFKALEPFYNEMYDLFLEYTDLSKTPVKKSFFSSNADKHKKELSSIFLNLRKSARKLIKSVDLFEEKLENSPLFGGAVELENKISNNSPIIDGFNLDSKEEIIDNSEDKLIRDEIFKPIENSDQKIEELAAEDSKVANDDIKFEERLQEEIAKLKIQLEAEFKNQANKVVEIEELTDKNKIEVPKPTEKKTADPTIETTLETNSNKNNNNEIDLDEEIRRILS